jgi:S-adenosylmethionine:tRNA ribosyltransferase-isomerase
MSSEFDYELPAELIAQRPLTARDASRMLLLERFSGLFVDRQFSDFPDVLRGNELIVVNDARVIPARLFAHRAGVRADAPGRGDSPPSESLNARIEVLLVRRLDGNVWEALVRPGRKVRTGEELLFEGGELRAEVIARGSYGLRDIRFSGQQDVLAAIERIGHVPLPPYLRRADEPADRERYQTIFAVRPGAVAAPTAGLHFTPAILERLRARKVEVHALTLEVGLGTFQPIHSENLDEHQMHSEAYDIPKETAEAVAKARREGRPVLAVGTTVVRALEDAAAKAATAGSPPATIPFGRGEASLFIRPGYRFSVVDQLLTNFHLPQSTLLILVAAFAGREQMLATYRHAVMNRYRFYSYGDCMLIR